MCRVKQFNFALENCVTYLSVGRQVGLVLVEDDEAEEAREAHIGIGQPRILELVANHFDLR